MTEIKNRLFDIIVGFVFVFFGVVYVSMSNDEETYRVGLGLAFAFVGVGFCVKSTLSRSTAKGDKK